MAVMVLLTLKTNESDVDNLRNMMDEILPDTRAYEGCQGIVAYQNQDEERDFVLVEQWDTRVNYEKYVAWRTDTGTLAKLVALCEGEPNIQIFDVTNDG